MASRSRQLAAIALVLGCSAGLLRGESVQAAPPATSPENPCLGHDPELRCPDLVMRRPYDLYYERVGRHLRLHAGNSIVNVGTGPMELVGRRATPLSMTVTQRIFAVDGSAWDFPSAGHLFFKAIPGLGPFWKFRNAARFELWSLNPAGHLRRRVQVGEKLVYCLRDLNKRFSNRYSPTRRHFPACSQNPDLRRRILGTSVGWSDDYPAGYYEQWIDVTGRRGRFAFVQVVDPLNQLYESDEENNRSPVVYLDLPPRG
jgi:Lysyl oxidase